jgi:hypothetical protein
VVEGTGKARYIRYTTQAGVSGHESVHERERRERFWRSLRKQVARDSLRNFINFV